ncbi:unnamed protein product [Dicrocoelium dendriticum]|nr:unnamed protein product [Dicrocoelium dendriticum]
MSPVDFVDSILDSWVKSCLRYNIAAEAKRSRLHQSIKVPLPDIKGTTDALLHVPLGDLSREFSLIRDKRHPRHQRESKRLEEACRSGDSDAALSVYFGSMLTRNRVMPSRFDTHQLLDVLAQTGRSEDAFRVLRKMKEIGLEPTQATYSRLFRACAEDSGAWYRENEHNFRISDATLSSPPVLRRMASLVERALSSEELLDQFGGPGLKRAQELWCKLQPDRARLSTVTYNSAIRAFAKGGDLQGCLTILNMMLDTGKPANHQNAITIDNFTVSALLSAIRPSLAKHALASSLSPPESVPQLDHFRLILACWHRLLRHDGSTRLSPHLFTSLLDAVKALPNHTISTDVLTVSPPVFSGPLAAPTSVTHEEIGELMTQTSQSPKKLVHSSTGTSVFARTLQVDWSNEALALRSPINLMFPTEYPLTLVYPQGRWQPWHRLALFGGLYGFLDAVERVYQSKPNALLLTQLIALLPQPKKLAPQTPDEWDVFEHALITWTSKHSVRLDMGFYNALIHRRVSAAVSANYVLQEAMRNGFTADQITWGSLARGCHTVPEVRQLLRAFSDASQPSDLCSSAPRHSQTLLTVRPSLRFISSIMFSNWFNWDVKAYALELLMGETDGTVCDGIEPDQRLVATLDIEVALFRELLTKGVIPTDGSPAPASAETGGLPVPAYAYAAFRRFIPLYKRWLRSSYRPVSVRTDSSTKIS